MSLKTLASTLLGKDLSKSIHITRSNWEASRLSKDQVLLVEHSGAAHVASYKILVHHNDMKWYCH